MRSSSSRGLISGVTIVGVVGSSKIEILGVLSFNFDCPCIRRIMPENLKTHKKKKTLQDIIKMQKMTLYLLFAIFQVCNHSRPSLLLQMLSMDQFIALTTSFDGRISKSLNSNNKHLLEPGNRLVPILNIRKKQ